MQDNIRLIYDVENNLICPKCNCDEQYSYSEYGYQMVVCCNCEHILGYIEEED